MASPPKWAAALITRVCADHGVPEPAVTWRRSRRSLNSSGRYFWDPARIVVTAGRSREDQRLVLLHELGHHLAPKGDTHTEAFWRIAWRLFRAYGVRLAHALDREGDYRKAALSVAAASGIRGAKGRLRRGNQRGREAALE